MIPQLHPLKLFSENCPIRAISVIETSNPNISFKITPVNTSKEAEEDNPEPFGIFPVSYTHLDVYKRQTVLSADHSAASVFQFFF